MHAANCCDMPVIPPLQKFKVVTSLPRARPKIVPRSFHNTSSFKIAASLPQTCRMILRARASLQKFNWRARELAQVRSNKRARTSWRARELAQVRSDKRARTSSLQAHQNSIRGQVGSHLGFYEKSNRKVGRIAWAPYTLFFLEKITQ
jgi:hypothetical protein